MQKPNNKDKGADLAIDLVQQFTLTTSEVLVLKLHLVSFLDQSTVSRKNLAKSIYNNDTTDKTHDDGSLHKTFPIQTKGT